MSNLLLEPEERFELWRYLTRTIEFYLQTVPEMNVTPALDPAAIRELLGAVDFNAQMHPEKAIDFIVNGFRKYQVHVGHPRYFGLFNPAPTTMGIAADALVAAFNPQLAAWSHNPWAAEIERELIRTFGERFGYPPEQADGTFTSGGMEANHTAVLTALNAAFPEFGQTGLRALPAQPVFYVSAESHHSFLKAAMLCGLGAQNLRTIPVNAALQMDTRLLSETIQQDKAAGHAPFMVVATAGTTNAGVVDPIEAIEAIARQHGLWCHVDAAWGGAAILVPELKPVLSGIERADSITFDAHKWLSVPMGAGLYLTRHPEILERTFRTQANYMPTEAAGLDIRDPFAVSMQWSRRFIGLKVYMSLMVSGWQGYEEAIRHQSAMGDLLREKLRKAGWRVVNDTRLPVVCFVDDRHPQGDKASYLQAIAQAIFTEGAAWISTTQVGQGQTVLRACITNYRTMPPDLDALLSALEGARKSAAGNPLTAC